MSEVIRFNYLYRDSGNYKKFGCKRFSNPDQLSLEVIEYNIRLYLISHEFFTPDCLGNKKIKGHRFQDDYPWYEFDSIEMMDIIYNPRQRMKSINFLFSKLEKMTNYEIYLISDQPTTCPKCGARTKLKLDMPYSPNKTQFHKCLSDRCKYFFAVEEDI